MPAEVGALANAGKLWLGSVGVGGVTNVVGVPGTLGGVAGKGLVLMRLLPALRGVCGRSSTDFGADSEATAGSATL